MLSRFLYKLHDFSLSISNRRSSSWDRVQKKFLTGHGTCAACGSNKKLNVHHIMPFHIYPEYELEEDNLITLCMSDNRCHFLVGHGGSWKAYNPDVRTHARKILEGSCNKATLLKKINESRLY